MSIDNNQVKDTVRVELNGSEVEDTTQLPPILYRPSDSATKAIWIDYCVSLGASREYLENSFTKAELIELADRLGG